MREMEAVEVALLWCCRTGREERGEESESRETAEGEGGRDREQNKGSHFCSSTER